MDFISILRYIIIKKLNHKELCISEDIKIEIGKRIREERERQGLTREQVCDTEEELTVKQLMRIELGRSLPTIVKLQYISDKLSVSLN